MNNTTNPKDLSKEAPRSPYMTLGGFAMIARTIDKCRAVIAGTAGEYHFDCPLDKMLFGFKELNAEEFKAYVAEGHTDEEIVEWVQTHGATKTDDEINTWSESFRTNFSYSTNEWFIGECARLGLNPETTTLFDMLEVDDASSFA